MNRPTKTHVAIACGGTGGHLFPGLAVAEQLAARDCAVTLLVSPKEVDQQAVQQVRGMNVATLPAVGLSAGKRLAFLQGFVLSYRASSRLFKAQPPAAALAMGGFTSAPPILAAKRLGARTFLHESNTIPGRANRWLSRVVHHAFVGFPQAAQRLHTRQNSTTGTPVRAPFHGLDRAACRTRLQLDSHAPVLLVTGGSQGASGLNDLVLSSLPLLARALPQLQLLWLTGTNDFEKARQAMTAGSVRGAVHPFLPEMHLALGAADVVVSRAGASSLAELAAARAPAVLVPFPAATDNHQLHNAVAFVEAGAARLLEQRTGTPEALVQLIQELASNESVRAAVREALGQWHAPRAAEVIAENILEEVRLARERHVRSAQHGGCSCGHDHHLRTRENAA